MTINKVRTNQPIQIDEVRIERENNSTFSITHYDNNFSIDTEPVEIVEFKELLEGTDGTIWERFIAVMEEVAQRHNYTVINIEERLYNLLKNATEEKILKMLGLD